MKKGVVSVKLNRSAISFLAAVVMILGMALPVAAEAPQCVLTAVAGAHQVSLTWESREADHFVIYRDGREIATTAENYYVDVNVAKYDVYRYQVQAVDAEGQQGPLSNTAVASDTAIGDSMNRRDDWQATAYACHESTQPGHAIDGNLTGSPWLSGQHIEPGSWFMVDMRRPVAFNQVVMNKDNDAPDAPATYEIYASMDGEDFHKVADGSWTGGRFYGTDNVFAQTVARYIKVVSTASTETNWWNIAHFDVRLTSRISREGWTASAYAAEIGGNPPEKVLDSDIYAGSGSAWISGVVQHVGDWFMLNLGKPVTFNRISIFSENRGDTPDLYSIEVSDDGQIWRPVAENVATKAYGLPNNSVGYDTAFPTQTVQYARIVAQGDKPGNWWNICDISLYLDNEKAGDAYTLNRAYWAAESEGGINPQDALDMTLDSYFVAGDSQTEGQYFLVDMQTPQVFNRVVTVNGGEYLRNCEIFTSSDKQSWASVYTGSGAQDYSVFDLPLQKARYIKVVCTGDDPAPWHIRDFQIFNEGCLDWQQSVTGDLNGNGAVDAQDIIAVKQAILLGQTVDADLNGDQVVNILDVVRMKRVIAGL